MQETSLVGGFDPAIFMSYKHASTQFKGMNPSECTQGDLIGLLKDHTTHFSPNSNQMVEFHNSIWAVFIPIK